MSLLTGLCGCIFSPCFLRPGHNEDEVTPSPRHPQTRTIPFNQNTNQPILQDGRNNGGGLDFDDGYSAIVPLPRYTPRPVSINEKTLETHMRDPPISSSTYARDEKNPELEPFPNTSEEVTSDVSSAISFPSSYGNTSTATRETPPPPYSPGPSPVHSRAMSISESSLITPPPMAHISQPPASFYPPGLSSQERFSTDERAGRARRFSWESR